MDKIYHLRDATTLRVVDYLKQHGFSRMPFVPVQEPQLCKTGYFSSRWIPPSEEKAVLLWGDGSHHQVSYHFSPERKYFKSIDDAHDDFGPFYYGKVECGNHNTMLVNRDNYLQGLEVLGVNFRLGKNAEINRIATQKDIGIMISKELKTTLSGEVVHKSIDLDVLKNYPCRWGYAIGQHNFEQMKANFETLLRGNQVVRFDVGGFSRHHDTRHTPRIKQGHGLREYKELLELYCGFN